MEKWADIKTALEEIKCQCIMAYQEGESERGTLLTILLTFLLSMHSYVEIKWKSPPIKIKFNAIASEREREFLYWIKCYFLSSCNLPHTTPLTTNIGPYQVYCNSISSLSQPSSTLWYTYIDFFRIYNFALFSSVSGLRIQFMTFDNNILFESRERKLENLSGF